MKILHSLYYYRPHYSGLTVYTERLVHALGQRGHQVTVLTSRYDPKLPSYEPLDGVEVRRLPVVLRVSKGPIMPSLPLWAWRIAREYDLIHLHVPQLDAAPIALIGKLLGKPVVLTYHCDLRLPKSPLNRLANWLSAVANKISVSLADVVVANARDYAEASTILGGFINKVQVIPPPIDMPVPSDKRIKALAERLHIQPGEKVIGMAARLATEKGVEFLVGALPLVQVRYPEARVIYVGQHLDVMGETAYRDRLMPQIEALDDAWTFLGLLSAEDMAAFFALCDVTVLPSLNSTESFGMVQVESMMCGTPVVASDIPGVRQATRLTGMGEVFAVADAESLAQGILNVLNEPDKYYRPREEIEAQFAVEVIADRYETLYREWIEKKDGQ